MNLTFERVSKHYGALPVLDGLDLDVASGEAVALVGPSGCGKSTLLGLAAGLEPASGGRVLANAREVRTAGPERTLVFQEHALFPWLTLRDNVAAPLEIQGRPRREARAEAERWLERVGLGGFEGYHPQRVSGGMRQRTALARAFIASPEALLLDEPFGALDALTKLQLQDVLRDLVAERAPTVLLVTHDVDEALYLADRVIVFGPRPARVLAALDVPAGRDAAELAPLRARVLELLGVRRDAPDPARHAPSHDAPSRPEERTPAHA